MKLKYFGSAAAEGVPALFCKCSACLEAKKRGGRDIRTRMQSLVNDELLIDFNGDTHSHYIKYDFDLADIEHLLVTHGHADHFYAEDLMMRMTGYSNGLENKMTVYGNERVHQFFDRASELEGFTDEDKLTFKEIDVFTPYKVGKYNVTALLADHDKKEKCLFYMIEENGESLLYAHDTGYFPKENWDYFEKTKPYFNLVSLDCTHQKVPVKSNHMSFYDNIKIKEELIKKGYADENTIFVISHFSHNGGMLYDEMNEWALKEGFITGYDGLEISF